MKLIFKIEISRVVRKDLENTIVSFIVADVPKRILLLLLFFQVVLMLIRCFFSGNAYIFYRGSLKYPSFCSSTSLLNINISKSSHFGRKRHLNYLFLRNSYDDSRTDWFWTLKNSIVKSLFLKYSDSKSKI